MRDFCAGLGYLMWGLCRIIIRTAAFMLRSLIRAVRRKREQRRRLAPSIAVNAPEQDAVASTGPATIIQTSAYEVADRIASIRLDPPVGIINLRIYSAARIVKRDLIINEPRLMSMMRGRRHTFPDAVYDPVQGLDALKDDSVALAETLINTLGNQSVRAAKPAPTVQKAKTVPAAPAPAVAVAPAQAPLSPPASSQASMPAGHERKEVHAKVFAPKPAAGITYVGKLLAARTETMTPPGRAPYETFQAILLLDNGVEMPLRGAELERELTGAACQVGQRVAITPVGKVPVALANGGEGSKNLYQVRNLS